jgi:hypothetical protein
MQCEAVYCERICFYDSEVPTDYFFMAGDILLLRKWMQHFSLNPVAKLKAKRSRLPDVRLRACNFIHLRSEFRLSIASHSINIQI